MPSTSRLAELASVRLRSQSDRAQLCPGRWYRALRDVPSVVYEGPMSYGQPVRPGFATDAVAEGEAVWFRGPTEPRPWAEREPYGLAFEDPSGRRRHVAPGSIGRTVRASCAVLENGPPPVPDDVPSAVRTWAHALLDRAPAVRRFALEALSPPAHHDRWVLPLLADRALDARWPSSACDGDYNPSGWSRWTAGEEALVARGEPARRYLEAEWAARRDVWDRRAVERVLARLGSGAFERGYLEALGSDDPLEVRRALRRLRAAGRPVDRGRLTPLLGHSNYNVRQDAQRTIDEVGA